MVIDPTECIDCGMCVDECKAHAIYPLDRVPESMVRFVEINRECAKLWPAVLSGRPPLFDADRMNGREGKLAQLVI